MVVFLGWKIFLFFEIYFWVGVDGSRSSESTVSSGAAVGLCKTVRG
jgi:hypothetical protein